MKSLELLVSYQNTEIKGVTYVENFEDLKIDSRLIKNLQKMMFSVMTPIQKHVTPFIIDGKDVMGCSQTGN